MARREVLVPLYEYDCRRDGRFEVIQKFSDPPLGVCPTCGDPVEKVVSAPAFQFKGSGWYVTDYARKSSGSEKGSTDDAGKKPAGGPATESAGGAAKPGGSTAESK